MTRGKRQELSFPGQDRRNMKNKRITAGIGESRKHILFIPFPCLGPHDRGNGANMLRSERYTSKRFCYSLNLDQNTFSKCKAPDGLYPARFFRPYNNSATASSGHSEAFWTADVRFIFTTASFRTTVWRWYLSDGSVGKRYLGPQIWTSTFLGTTSHG